MSRLPSMPLSTDLASPRLSLRPLTVADVTDAYVGWLNDPEVTRFLETRHAAQTRETVEAFVAAVAARAHEHLFAIRLRAGGRHVGNIKVGPIHPLHRVGDVSLLIGARDVWGQGYAAEAIELVSRHAFGALGARKLSASLYAANVGSERAFLKAGWRREGLRRAHYALDGERSDIVELGLIPEDLGRPGG